jgi:DNA-binding CsgD family transcriptional regulator
VGEPASSSWSVGAAATWPMVGRVNELAEVAQARARGTGGVVVHAPAGVGKSRLAREALAEAERGGMQTLWVQATRSAATVPLGAFAAVIPVEIRSDDRFELLRGSVQALGDLARGRPLMLGVDDAQLLDQTSASLVLHLANADVAFVLATVRTGEPCPDAIISLWKDAGARRVELAALDERDTGELVESVVGGPVEQRVLRWVWDASRGNALYVRELLLGALGSGALSQVNGFWRLRVRPALSGSLADLISARLHGLDGRERRALELLALGEPLRLHELIELAGGDPVASAEDRGLISVEGSLPAADVRLGHPLYGEVLVGALPRLRARELRLALAATVQGRGELTPQDSLRVARWLVDAGEPIPSATLLDAAQAASLSGDPDLGADLAQRAIQTGGGVRASMLLARAYVIRKRYAEGESTLGGLEGAIDSPDVAIAYLQQRIPLLYWGLKRPAEARALIDRAQDWWPDAAWSRRLDPVRLGRASLLDGFSGAVEGSAEMLADDSLENEVRREVELVHALNLFYSGRAVAAYELIRTQQPTIPLGNHHDERVLIGWVQISFESGQGLAALNAEMTAALQQGVRAGDHAASGLGALGLGALAYLAGRYRHAARFFAEAEVHFEHRDTFGALMITRAFQVGVACMTGDQEIDAAMGRCHDALQGHDPLPNQLPYLIRAQGWAAVGRHDRPRAQRLLLDAAARLEQMPLHAAQLSYEAMRAGAPAPTVARALSALLVRCDAPLASAYAQHALAAAAHDGARLLDAAGEFERIGALRYATEAAADAAGAFVQAGRQDSARRAAARSRELFGHDQDGTLPPIDGVDREAVELTPREEQLVELAAHGLSNAQIADQLVLSVRTVESHLYRAMQKLGVSHRQELVGSR